MLADMIDRIIDCLQSRCDLREELFSRSREHDAARGAVEEPDRQALFQRCYCVAQCR